MGMGTMGGQGKVSISLCLELGAQTSPQGLLLTAQFCGDRLLGGPLEQGGRPENKAVLCSANMRREGVVGDGGLFA